MFPVVVHPPGIPQLPFTVKNKKLWRVGCAEGLRNRLILVAEIREIKSLLLRPQDHLLKAVLRIVLRIIGINRNNLHALCSVIALQRDNPVFISADIWTMVAGEDNHKNVLV